LRTLLVATTVLSVWLGFYLKSFRDRRAAIAALEKAPAAFSFRWDGPARLHERVRGYVAGGKRISQEIAEGTEGSEL
jgi:hypothetical protein